MLTAMRANRLESTVRWLVERVEGAVVEVAPWLSPLPTAILTGQATVRHFGWNEWGGIIVGIVVETLGFAATSVTLTLMSHNAQLSDNPSDKHSRAKWGAPTWLAGSMTLVYLLAVTSLLVVFDVYEQVAFLAPLLFPLLSTSAFVTAGIHRTHRARVDAMIAKAVYPYTGKRYRARKEGLLAAGAISGEVAKPSKPVVQRVATTAGPYDCWCGEACSGRYAFAAHSKRHRNEVAGCESPGIARELLCELYPGTMPPPIAEVSRWLKRGG